MKKFLAVVFLIFGLLFAILMTSHYYPEKVPKKIATFIPIEYYKKIPRQVREYFPWMKPKTPDKAYALNIKELNARIEEVKAQEEAKKKAAPPQGKEEVLQQVLEDFYQKLAEGTFDQSFQLMHPVSQESFSGANFVNYYTLLKDTFVVNKSSVEKNPITISQYKEPITGKTIKNLVKAKVTLEVSDTFSRTKIVTETVKRDMYFAQDNGQWKIVELELNNKNYKEKKYYYFVDEGYKRLAHKDSFGAIDFFRKAIRENKLSLNANYGLSVALHSIAYYDRAIETVQKMQSIYNKKYVSKLVVDNIDLKTVKKLDVERLSNGYYIMASSLIKKGNLPGAKDALHKALALNPKNTYASAALKTIPTKIAAKPAPMLYKDEGAQVDPFQEFRATGKVTQQQPSVMAIDPKEAVNMLNSR